MNINALQIAINEAERFLLKANELILAESTKRYSHTLVPKESGTVRRSSMDLTRALAELRKYN